MRLLGIHHIALNVHHLDRAEHFYTDVLGFKVSQRFSKGLRHLMLDAGNSKIALFEVIRSGARKGCYAGPYWKSIWPYSK